MSKPIQTHFPELPPPLSGGEETEVEVGLLGGKRDSRAASRGKSSARASGLPEVIAVVRFLRWFADRRFPCLVCDEPVDDSEYSALYRDGSRVVAMYCGHARCREAENAKTVRRAEAICGCTVVLPTLVRVASCVCDHDRDDCGCDHKIGTVQVAPVGFAFPLHEEPPHPAETER